jgi:hypothetical protein
MVYHCAHLARPDRGVRYYFPIAVSRFAFRLTKIERGREPRSLSRTCDCFDRSPAFGRAYRLLIPLGSFAIACRRSNTSSVNANDESSESSPGR